MILLLSNNKFDKSSEDIFDWIHHYKGDVIRLNAEDLLSKDFDYCFNIRNNKDDFLLSKDGKIINVEDIRVIWNWRWYEYNVDKINKWKLENYNIRRYVYDELNVIGNLLLKIFKNAYIIGDRYINKPQVLRLAKECKLQIPETIISNQKEKILEFLKVNKKIICKPLSNPIFITYENGTYGMYTSIIEEEDFDIFENNIFPILSQKYIKKEFELRIFYLAGQFYTAAIISQNDSKTKVDFREYNLQKPNRILPFKLPNIIEKKLMKLMNKLNLETSSIDMIYNKGTYYFLEINPVGQFDMISYPCNYQLPKNIALYLINKDGN